MNKEKIAIRGLALGLVLSLLGILTPIMSPAHAQGISSIPIQVAPAREQLELDPGEEATFEFRFFNLGTVPLTGIVKAADFMVLDDKGTPTILDNPQNQSPRFSGASWISLPFDKINIAPDDKVNVQGKIKVPANAHPGGRYIAVYFEPNTKLPNIAGAQEEAALGLQQRIAGLLYIKVSGPITEKALISRFKIPGFQEYGPINLEADILNRGDYHIRPQGSVSLTNMFGGLVDQKKIDGSNIFPDAERTYNFTIGKKWMFGKYTVSAAASYGSGGQLIQKSMSVWILPWKLIAIFVLAIIILMMVMKNMYTSVLTRQDSLKDQLEEEHEKLEELRNELKHRNDEK